MNGRGGDLEVRSSLIAQGRVKAAPARLADRSWKPIRGVVERGEHQKPTSSTASTGGFTEVRVVISTALPDVWVMEQHITGETDWHQPAPPEPSARPDDCPAELMQGSAGSPGQPPPRTTSVYNRR